MSVMPKETKKKVYCGKGTRKNPKTGKCEPINKPEGSLIESIKEAVLSLRPTDLSKRVAEPVPEPVKKPKTVVNCNKNYLPSETENARKTELMALTGINLRKIHSTLINDPSVLNVTPGIKTKEQLVHLILCLENEQKQGSPLDEKSPSTIQQIISSFTPLKIYNGTPEGCLTRDSRATLPINELYQAPIKDGRPDSNLHRCKPTEIIERVEEPVEEPIISKPKLVIRPTLPEPSLDEETKIVIETPVIEEPPVIDGEQVLEEPLKVSEQEEKLQNQFGVAPTNIESKEYNSFLFNKEKLENENLRDQKDDENLAFLYPELNDPNFNIKIAQRKEFNDTQYDGTIYDIKEQANRLCNADFELLPHQQFVKNFMSMQTPYNCLLLYHALGSGKSCSSIGIAEEMRAYMKQIGLNQPIIVVASPNVQENYRLQLFDERKLKMVNGLWTSNTCIGNALLNEINPTNLTGIPKDRIISEINTIINRQYTFMGYTELANYIKRHTDIPQAARFSLDQQKVLRIKKIHKYFDNRLIIIDEAHNIRISDDNREDAKTATLLMDVARYANNMRLLMLSATPMYNSYKEIIWLTNLMNMVDKRATIQESDVFDKEGQFLPERTTKDGQKIEGGRELLQRKLTGYVSFIRGENPYTFPLRIYPDTFSPENAISSVEKYPNQQLNGKPIEESIQHTPIFVSQIGEYQKRGYDFIMNHLRNKSFITTNKFGQVRELPSFENMESFGYTLLMQPLQALNIVYPSPDLYDIKEDLVSTSEDVSPTSARHTAEIEDRSRMEPYPQEKNEEIIKKIVGKNGLYRIMNRKEDKGAIPNIYDFEYKPGVDRIFSPENIGKYSSKIAKICEIIQKSSGIVLIYSQYIEGGVVPIALALEEIGFGRFSVASHIKSLFKEAPVEPIDALTMKPRSQLLKEGGDPAKFSQAKYMLITGNNAFSPENLADIKYATNPDNKNGEKVKVIIISKAGSEGLDFKCIRQVHILEPWYNMSRIEQIIGRGVRNLSHCPLEFEKRNVEIYLHGTLPGTSEEPDEEPADLYVYRFAEKKAAQIGKVTRLLKEIAVDCLLNIGQTNLTVEKLAEMAQNKDIQIELSSKGGGLVPFSIGDKPFTQICDYMDNCAFTCSPTSPIEDSDIIQETYNDDFLKMNYSGIVKRIRDLFRERVSYNRDELIASINILKKYPTSHIDYALSRFVDNKSEFVFDRWNRTGYLINRDQLYVFQPTEITDETLSVFERTVPIDHKREYVEIELPKEKAPLLVENEEAVETDVGTISDQYDAIVKKLGGAVDLINEWRTNKQQNIRISSGESDWYMNLGYVFDTIVENHKIPEADIQLFAIQHFLDLLSLEERLVLVQYLYDIEGQGLVTMPFQSEIKDYFDTKMVTVRGLKTIILVNDKMSESSEDRLKIYLQDDSEKKSVWSAAQPTDRIAAIKAAIPTSFVPLAKMNRLVGFMQVFRNNDIVFKTLDVQSKLKKGSRCGGEGKKDVMKKVNMISLFQYNEENTEDTALGKNLIVKPGMCCILEMLLRHYNKGGRDGLVWFLDLERAVLSKLVK